MEGLALDRDILTALIAIASFAVIGIVVFGFHLLGKPARQMRKRLERATAPYGTTTIGEKRLSVRRDLADSSIPTLDKLAKRLVPRPAAMRARLAKTGKNINLGLYLLICLLVGLLALVASMNALGLAMLPAVLIGLTLGIALPHLVIGIMIGRRMKKFVSSFPDSIDIIVRGLRSGLPVTESMNIVSREMTGPVAEEFARVGDGMKVGQTLEEILWETAERIDVPEFRFFVIAMSIQRETGGNLAETLENLSDVLRKRHTMRLKVKALSSEARASAVIIAALPFVMMGIIMSVNAEYIMQLFDDPRGTVLLIGAGVSLLIGIFVMAKMIRFEI